MPPGLLQFLGACAGRAAAVERLVGSLEVDASAFRARFAWMPPLPLAAGLAAAVGPTAPL
jgi:UDP-glucose 4-epimerase